jgi:phosphatidylinositol 3-kinase
MVSSSFQFHHEFSDLVEQDTFSMVCGCTLSQVEYYQSDLHSLVDFGYILGRDPKPFPPQVKVCKEMVDGMGGAQSPHYARFKNFCFTAFTILRKSTNLILNLVTLMVDANIPDIKHRDVHEQLQEKFRLDLTEEEAIKHFEVLLNETSYITVVLDRFHDLAQYWRS